MTHIRWYTLAGLAACIPWTPILQPQPNLPDTSEPPDTAEQAYQECIAALEGDPTAGGEGICGGETMFDPAGYLMIGVPAGTFLMGSPEDEIGRDECTQGIFEGAETQHQVTLTRDFWIGATEVTQGEFEAVMGFIPTDDPYCPDCAIRTGRGHAMLLANALSELEGLSPCYCLSQGEDMGPTYIYDPPYDCEGYRLPTDAEWEYAARAGSSTAFPNGANLAVPASTEVCEAAVLDDGSDLGAMAWFCDGRPAEEVWACSLGWTDDPTDLPCPMPVAQLEPNAFGLYDTSGNVWEYVNDRSLASNGRAEVDPYVSPEDTDETGWVVIRGGSLVSTASCVRSAAKVNTLSLEPLVGFRLARTCR